MGPQPTWNFVCKTPYTLELSNTVILSCMEDFMHVNHPPSLTLLHSQFSCDLRFLRSVSTHCSRCLNFPSHSPSHLCVLWLPVGPVCIPSLTASFKGEVTLPSLVAYFLPSTSSGMRLNKDFLNKLSMWSHAHISLKYSIKKVYWECTWGFHSS
jgi:hypothetical protein